MEPTEDEGRRPTEGPGPGGAGPAAPAAGSAPAAAGPGREEGLAAGGGRPIEAAETAAERTRTDGAPLGRPGRPVDRRSPYLIGLFGAAGVATTYGAVRFVVAAGEVLTLVGLSLFLAVGLEPAVRALTRRLPRWLAVTVVGLAILAVVAGFLAAAIPPLIQQGSELVERLPQHLRHLRDHSSLVGRLNDRFHLEQRVRNLASSEGPGLVNGVLGAGEMVLTATAATATVLVLTLYFLADLPRIRRLIYRLFPHSRRARAILIGDQMFAKVGGFVLGNLITSLIAGLGTFVWLVIFGVPYALLLSIMVALLDLIPIVGSTLGGIIVSAVALSVSVPVALATAGFYVAFRITEDYLLVPKIVGRVVEVPATLTLVAVLVGGVVYGIIGAIIAIPAAAAIRIVLQETVFPRLDRS